MTIMNSGFRHSVSGHPIVMTEAIDYKTVLESEVTTWYKAAPVTSFPENGGACVLYQGKQFAVFNFTRRNEWYACQNLCPHKRQMILARGMIGSTQNEPKVACPFHKRTFSLQSGQCLNADECNIATYPVKVENGFVYLGFAD